VAREEQQVDWQSDLSKKILTENNDEEEQKSIIIEQ